jgi:hypothetical protein
MVDQRSAGGAIELGCRGRRRELLDRTTWDTRAVRVDDV